MLFYKALDFFKQKLYLYDICRSVFHLQKLDAFKLINGLTGVGRWKGENKYNQEGLTSN